MSLQNVKTVAATLKTTKKNSIVCPSTRLCTFICVVFLALLGFAAYSNTFHCPFIFDDTTSIQDNVSIRSWRTALFPNLINGETTSGRPILNLTFAISYAISGQNVWGYHAGNILVHVFSAIALYGAVRRTLLLPGVKERFGSISVSTACLVAAIWVVHPLTTEAVTYMVQRAESLMALFYLVTFYCFLRAATTDKNQNNVKYLWLMLSWLTCGLGMATKEVMVSAPIILILFDSAFIAGSIKEAWRNRGKWYLSYAATWILLVFLMIHTGSRGKTVGFVADAEINWWTYALTQCWGFVRYIRLSFIPSPLIFDYGLFVYTKATQVWWQILFVAGFVTTCFYLFWRTPRVGWLGLFFLAVLAPTTSIIPVVTQVLAEHRMYLPLTAVITSAVLATAWFFPRRLLWIGFPIVAVFLGMTFDRNKIYKDNDLLWIDIVQKYPQSARANANVGNMYVKQKDFATALVHLTRAIELNPSLGDHYNNMGNAYARMRQYEKAVTYYRMANGKKITREDIFYANYCEALMKLNLIEETEAVAKRLLLFDPNIATGLVVMGNLSRAKNDLPAAEEYYRRALESDSKNSEAWNNWGNIKALQGGKLDEALKYYKKAAMYAPESADIQDNAARLLVQLGRWKESLPYFEAELNAEPADNKARLGYADALYAERRFEDAAVQYKTVLLADSSKQRHVGAQVVTLMKNEDTQAALPLAQVLVDIAPENVSNQLLIANILVTLKQSQQSLQHYEAAIGLAPTRVSVRFNYAIALDLCGRQMDAAVQYEQALKLAPDQAIIHHSYALLLEKLGRIQDAILHEREALRLQPVFEDASKTLERLLASE